MRSSQKSEIGTLLKEMADMLRSFGDVLKLLNKRDKSVLLTTLYSLVVLVFSAVGLFAFFFVDWLGVTGNWRWLVAGMSIIFVRLYKYWIVFGVCVSLATLITDKCLLINYEKYEEKTTMR